MPATRTTIALATVFGALTIASATACSGIRNTLVDGVDHDEPITMLNIEGGSGDLTVSTDPTVKGVDIRRTVKYLNHAPSMEDSVHFDGEALTLRTQCGSSCSVSFMVTVPQEGLKVKGDNGSGNISLSNMSDVDIDLGSGDVDVRKATGTVRVNTGSGNVNLTDIAGTASVTTGSGDVSGDNLTGASTTVQVGSGNINLHVSGAGDVQAVATSGDVDIWVPDATCRFTVHSSSGDQAVNAAPDPNSAHLIEARTTSGNVTIMPAL